MPSPVISLLVALFHQAGSPGLEEVTLRPSDRRNERPRPDRGTVEVQRLARALEGMSSRLEGVMADLKREKSYLKSLLESLPVGVLVVDREKKIRYANAALGRLLRDLPERADGALYTGAVRDPGLIELIDRAFEGEDRTASFVLRDRTETFLGPSRSVRGGVLVVVHDSPRGAAWRRRGGLHADAGTSSRPL